MPPLWLNKQNNILGESMRNKPMTLKDHNELADDLAIVCRYIDKVNEKLKLHYGKTSTIKTYFNKLIPLRPNGAFAMIFGELEKDYDAVVTDEQYKGALYANFEERYEHIVARSFNDCEHTVKESER